MSGQKTQGWDWAPLPEEEFDVRDALGPQKSQGGKELRRQEPEADGRASESKVQVNVPRIWIGGSGRTSQEVLAVCVHTLPAANAVSLAKKMQMNALMYKTYVVYHPVGVSRNKCGSRVHP